MYFLLLSTPLVVFRPLTLKEALVRIHLIIELREIAPAARQLNVRLLLCLRYNIALNFVLLCVKHASRRHIGRQISDRDKVANSEPLQDSLGLFVGKFVQH